jgi:hypothetical protein
MRLTLRPPPQHFTVQDIRNLKKIYKKEIRMHESRKENGKPSLLYAKSIMYNKEEISMGYLSYILNKHCKQRDVIAG